MIKKLSELLELSRGKGKRLVVAVAQDEVVLKAVDNAAREDIVVPTLVGDEKLIKEEAEKAGIDVSKYEIVHVEGVMKAAAKAVELVSKGEADLIMKGKLQTAQIMRMVLKEEYGLRTGMTMGMVSVFEIPDFPRLLILTDAGMTITPDLSQKVDLIKHAIRVANVLGIETPKVALVSAVETVNPKIPATIDAALIAKMADRRQIKGAIIDGPFALDNVVSKEAAEHKGIVSPVAGEADIIVTPDIDAGNILYKGLIFLAKAKCASTILGAKVPVVLTSRADSDETKLYSIALTAALS
ncbi:MAG: bifunctional enoyl-CoA hydratase/phosphate acetyltransferase [Thermotogaceae bacterium]|nr:bifunctional enoyl-CoA hydratase/phosphate acetyltransferase [Thermotogaceae bacterium]